MSFKGTSQRYPMYLIPIDTESEEELDMRVSDLTFFYSNTLRTIAGKLPNKWYIVTDDHLTSNFRIKEDVILAKHYLAFYIPKRVNLEEVVKFRNSTAKQDVFLSEIIK